jgi:hypothetical protein
LLRVASGFDLKWPVLVHTVTWGEAAFAHRPLRITLLFTISYYRVTKTKIIP